jgi:hypothetical protein
MSLQINSPALGNGNCNLGSPAAPVTTDQRGIARKTPCDIGAYEHTGLFPAKVVFIQQPTSTAQGAFTSPAVTVAVQDASCNTVTTDNTTQITLAIGANSGSGILSGTKTVTVVNGIATFSDLSINHATTNYTLVASSSELTSATSSSFNISPVLTQLGFVQQPTNGYTNTNLSPAITVQLLDANGELVSQSGVSITIAIGANPSSATLSGTLTRTTTNGVATFSNLKINNAGTGYTLVASSSGLTAATSTTFNIALAPTQLGFVQQPPATGYTATTLSPSLTVRLLDVNGQPVNKGSVAIILSVGSNPGSGILSGTLTRYTNTSGVATFSGLSVNNAGTGYTLVASSTGLTSATSNSFNILPTPTQLGFVQQPTNAYTNTSLSPAMTVRLLDTNGQPVSKSGVSITLAIGTNPGSGILSGTLTRPTNTSGVATFNDIKINNAGTGYTLVASSTGLSRATSTTFNISLPPTQLGFVQQPPVTGYTATVLSPAMTVKVAGYKWAASQQDQCARHRVHWQQSRWQHVEWYSDPSNEHQRRRYFQ